MKVFRALLVLAFAMTSLPAIAQREKRVSPVRNYSISIYGGESGYDVAVGAELGSPPFFKQNFCVRLKGSINWLELYKAEFDRWSTYKTVGVNLVYKVQTFERGRAYVEAGPFFILPKKCFSAKKYVEGINAAVGSEMFLISNTSINVAYYFSVGVSLTSATAEILDSRPKYGNGLLFANGFRIYF